MPLPITKTPGKTPGAPVNQAEAASSNNNQQNSAVFQRKDKAYFLENLHHSEERKITVEKNISTFSQFNPDENVPIEQLKPALEHHLDTLAKLKEKEPTSKELRNYTFTGLNQIKSMLKHISSVEKDKNYGIKLAEKHEGLFLNLIALDRTLQLDGNLKNYGGELQEYLDGATPPVDMESRIKNIITKGNNASKEIELMGSDILDAGEDKNVAFTRHFINTASDLQLQYGQVLISLQKLCLDNHLACLEHHRKTKPQCMKDADFTSLSHIPCILDNAEKIDKDRSYGVRLAKQYQALFLNFIEILKNQPYSQAEAGNLQKYVNG
jgi:hypothetical protein